MWWLAIKALGLRHHRRRSLGNRQALSRRWRADRLAAAGVGARHDLALAATSPTPQNMADPCASDLLVRPPEPADVPAHPGAPSRRRRFLRWRLPLAALLTIAALRRHAVPRPAPRHPPLIVLGLDPGLGTTGWGVIEADGNRLSPHRQRPAQDQRRRAAARTPRRPRRRSSDAILAEHAPDGRRGRGSVRQQEPAIDAQARPGARGRPDERRPRRTRGRRICPDAWSRKPSSAPAAPKKPQVHAMVQRLLPGCAIAGPDAADALAVAITHAHHLRPKRLPLVADLSASPRSWHNPDVRVTIPFVDCPVSLAS